MGRFTRKRWVESSFGSPSRYAVQEVLVLANESAPPLRSGLTSAAAAEALKSLRVLLDAPGICLTDTQRVLAWEGTHDHHMGSAPEHARQVLDGRPTDVQPTSCKQLGCPISHVVVAPLIVGGIIAGTLQTYSSDTDLATVRAVAEVARWVATQVELGDLERAKSLAEGAQLRALRAQISPHFVFNSLNTIASFMRTDPERARELLMEFADFARYSFSSNEQFTTLADELRAVDVYVSLERARFGDRLSVSIRVAPEVLGVRVPFLVLQPVVENALQHGLFRKEGGGTLRVNAIDQGNEARITIEDDGLGMDPDILSEYLSGRSRVQSDRSGFGLASVDERMRTSYGDEFGLVIETEVGMGTKITMRFPKFRSTLGSHQGIAQRSNEALRDTR